MASAYPAASREFLAGRSDAVARPLHTDLLLVAQQSISRRRIRISSSRDDRKAHLGSPGLVSVLDRTGSIVRGFVVENE